MKRTTTIFASAALITTTGLVASLSTAQTSDRNNQAEQDRNAFRDSARTQNRTTITNPHLKKLDGLKGEWKVEIQMHGDKKMGSRSASNTKTIEGTATRKWKLDNSILHEEFEVTSTGMSGYTDRGNSLRDRNPGLDEDDTDTDRSDRLNRRDGMTDRSSRMNQDKMKSLEDFKGIGLFGYDSNEDRFTHLWADSMGEGMILSYGEMNNSTNTITFKRHFGDTKGSSSYSKRDSRTNRKDTLTRDRDEEEEADGVMGREEQRFRDADDYEVDEPNRSGDRSDRMNRGNRMSGDQNKPVVMLRIVNDNKHIVEMTRPGHDGMSAKTYKITYTRKGAGDMGTLRDRRQDNSDRRGTIDR